MSLQSSVVCDRCGKVGPVRRCDTDASDAAEEEGWGYQRIDKSKHPRGQGVLDLCPSCKGGGGP